MKYSEARKKISIDFTQSALKKLSEYRAEHEAASNSDVINGLLDTFLDIPASIKREIAECCNKQIEVEKGNNGKGLYGSEFSESCISCLRKIVNFMNEGQEKIISDCGTESGMKEIAIASGRVIYPENWIVIDYCRPEKANYAGVVEVRNGVKYGDPHFLFFSDVKISKINENDIYLLCREAYPKFGEILEKRVELQKDEYGKILNLEEWKNAPEPGCFCIADAGTEGEFPFGAKVIRNLKS